jgi:hypothetical protein
VRKAVAKANATGDASVAAPVYCRGGEGHIRRSRSSCCREGAGKGFEVDGEGGTTSWAASEAEQQSSISLYIMHASLIWACGLSFQGARVMGHRAKSPMVLLSWAIEPSLQRSVCLGPSSQATQRNQTSNHTLPKTTKSKQKVTGIQPGSNQKTTRKQPAGWLAGWLSDMLAD